MQSLTVFTAPLFHCRKLWQRWVVWERLCCHKLNLKSKQWYLQELVQVIIRLLIQFRINLHECVFQKPSKPHECKLIPNWTRKVEWLLINNIHKKIAWRKWGFDAFVDLNRPFFAKHWKLFRVSPQNFVSLFMWYWLIKSTIVFQPIIFQNFDL